MKQLLLLSLLFYGCGASEKTAPPAQGNFPPPVEPIPDPRPAPSPNFQTIDTIEDSISLDLQRLDSDFQRQQSRYFVGCDRYNLGQQMDEFQQGINRGINQLSTDRELYPVTAVGPANCIYRVELDKIGWTKSDWETLANNDVLFFVSQTVRGRTLQFLTQSRRPYLYGSSAMVTAYEGDQVADKKGRVYYTLTKQAIETGKFFQQQGIVRQVEVNNEDAMYSGFSQSQIALGKTRMIAVFDSLNGSVISTYDTALGGDDLFTNPFTLELISANQINGQVLSKRLFKHAAQEHIASLPNGLFGLYRLNNAQDIAEIAAPNNIVINLEASKNQMDSTIRIGDCSVCHYKEAAAIPFRDQLRAHVLGNPAFSTNEKRLATIFFRFDRVTARIDELNREHTRAMQALGITAAQDPLWNVVVKPIRLEMNIDQVASLMFMDTPTFRSLLQGSSVSSVVLGNLLNGGSVSLATLSANFATLVRELAAFEDANL